MVIMANETSEVVLSMQDLREVTSYAAESAQGVLETFEKAHPADSRPRNAIEAAWTVRSRWPTREGTARYRVGGRRRRRPETQTPPPRAMQREQPCAQHPLHTCIHWPRPIR